MNSKDILIVVDAQNDFLLPFGKLFIGHDTTEYRKRLGEFVNNFPGYVYATKDTHFEGASEFKTFPEHCLIETDGWEIISEINPDRINNISAKNAYNEYGISSFILHSLYGRFDSEINPEITVYVVGVCVHICVHDIVTGIVNEAKHLFNRNPKIVIIKDLVDDFDQEMSEFALKRLQKLYGVEVI